MFDWIFDSIVGMWLVWNFWSLVPVIVFIALSILAYKRITAPVGGLQKQNYKENQRMLSSSITSGRRIITMLLTTTILVMGGILFSISLYKMG